MLQNILAVAWKELQIIIKDKGWLAILFLLPLMMSMLFGSVGRAVTSSNDGEEEAKAFPDGMVGRTKWREEKP